MGLLGSDGRPGEVHLSIGGVLFLDELPEFRQETIRDVYESVARERTYGCRLPVRPRVAITAANPMGRMGDLTLDDKNEGAMADPFVYDKSNIEQFKSIF